MDFTDPIATLDTCVTEGGPFPGFVIAVFLLATGLYTAWFLSLSYRARSRRESVRRIHDLILEGSLGQAIILADNRAADPTLAVLRSVLATIQATKHRGKAINRLDSEIKEHFARSHLGPRMLGAGLLLLVALAPLGLGVGGQLWAGAKVSVAAQAMEQALDSNAELGVAKVWSEGRATPVYQCPPRIGAPLSFLLFCTALLLTTWEIRLRATFSRKEAVRTGTRFIEMSARVLDPSYAVYARELGTTVRRSPRTDIPTGGPRGLD